MRIASSNSLMAAVLSPVCINTIPTLPCVVAKSAANSFESGSAFKSFACESRAFVNKLKRFRRTAILLQDHSQIVLSQRQIANIFGIRRIARDSLLPHFHRLRVGFDRLLLVVQLLVQHAQFALGERPIGRECRIVSHFLFVTLKKFDARLQHLVTNTFGAGNRGQLVCILRRIKRFQRFARKLLCLFERTFDSPRSARARASSCW